MAVKTLGPLLRDSMNFCKRRWMVLLLGAMVFGFLTQGVSVWLLGSQAIEWEKEMAPLSEQANSPQMQELITKVQSGKGTQADIQQLAAMSAATVSSLPAADAHALCAHAARSGLGLLLTTLIGLLAKCYFVMVAVKDIGDVGEALSVTSRTILPLFGMFLWVIVRSFIWIPFIGILIAIILGPRFILSPLYLLQQKKGVIESVSQSYKATQGYWGKIMGNCWWQASSAGSSRASSRGSSEGYWARRRAAL